MSKNHKIAWMFLRPNIQEKITVQVQKKIVFLLDNFFGLRFLAINYPKTSREKLLTWPYGYNSLLYKLTPNIKPQFCKFLKGCCGKLVSNDDFCASKAVIGVTAFGLVITGVGEYKNQYCTNEQPGDTITAGGCTLHGTAKLCQLPIMAWGRS